MSTITNFFEQEVIKKIQAKNTLDKKLEESRLGFNKGISYLENLCNQLQEHIPTLSFELEVNSKSNGYFVFIINKCRIVIKFCGKYNDDGSSRIGFYRIGHEFVLFYKNNYWEGKEDFEQELIKEIVSKLDIVQMK
jgi:hypothetical protein